MKKVLLISVSIGLLIVLAAPTASLAQPSGPPECCQLGGKAIQIGTDTPCAANSVVGSNETGAYCPGKTITCPKSNWGIYCLINGIYTVTDWIFFILIAVVAIMVLYGAFQIVTAGGDPGKVSTGRNFIVYAMVGFALALLAKAIPSIAKSILGMG